MEPARKLTEDITVNDGKGLFDGPGLIDTLTVDCNTLIKHLVSGQYVAFSSKIVEMVQKLTRLKEGHKEEMKARDDEIRRLKEMINEVKE